MVDPKRFLHLERERQSRDEPARPPRGEVAERFRGSAARPDEVLSVEQSPDELAGGEMPTGMSARRFQEDASSGLALDDNPNALSFQRCVQCGTDNSRFVSFCERCEGSLTTPEQRAHQEVLEHEQIQARQAEEMELSKLRATREAATHSEQARVHAAAEALGRALELPEGRNAEAWERVGPRRGPLGPRLLKQIADPRKRMAALVGGIGLLALPWLVPGTSFGVRLATLAAFVVLFGTGRRRPRGFWED